jgi:hypothetical protein
MIKTIAYDWYIKAIRKIDWKLLLFLVLFLDVKLFIKVLAIAVIYLLRFNFHFGFRLHRSRLPWFYPVVIVVAFFNLVLYALYSNTNYDIAFATGIFLWMLCILAIHQIRLFVEILDIETIHNTLIAFFFINALVSLANLLHIIIETGALNPYQYQGMFQKYFIGTGDHIRGISFDTSTTNAIINSFGIVYFLQSKKMMMVLLCMIIMLLTGSNLTNILTIIVLIYLFIKKSTREQKSIITMCLFMFVIFMSKISPQNHEYARGMFNHFFLKGTNKNSKTKPDTTLTPAEQKQKLAQAYIDNEYAALQKQNKLAAIMQNNAGTKPSVPEANINAPEYQNRNDTTALQKELISFVKEKNINLSVFFTNDGSSTLPGKLISMQQTALFLQQHPWKIFTGTGIGNFSSKLAFRITSLNIAGSYPAKYFYLDSDFAKNHLAVFLYYFTRQRELHSIVNTPDSVYNHLAGEYGLAGIIAFLFFYIGFFVNRIKKIADIIPYLFIMLSAFAIGYWFEQLSIVPVFELIIFLNIKEQEQPVTT